MRWKSFPKYVYSIALVWLYAIQKKKKKTFKLKAYICRSSIELLINSLFLEQEFFSWD